MSLATPLFMTNEAWYEYKEGAYEEYGTDFVLTEEGRKHPEVVESWEDFVRNDSSVIDLDELEERDRAMELFGISD